MWIEYNPNPVGRNVEDCAIRAVAKALDTDWETAYALIVANGFQMGNIISANEVWQSVLRQNGFKRSNIPNTCPDCYTIADFCRDNPNGLFVLGTGRHVVTVIDGDYFDTWDSGDEVVAFIWYK